MNCCIGKSIGYTVILFLVCYKKRRVSLRLCYRSISAQTYCWDPGWNIRSAPAYSNVDPLRSRLIVKRSDASQVTRRLGVAGRVVPTEGQRNVRQQETVWGQMLLQQKLSRPFCITFSWTSLVQTRCFRNSRSANGKDKGSYASFFSNYQILLIWEMLMKRAGRNWQVQTRAPVNYYIDFWQSANIQLFSEICNTPMAR